MSSNRLIYDTCAYAKKIDESVGPLAYVLNPMKYENCNKCRHELGLVGGTAVSHIQGNLVDLENDLRGATRQASLCPSKKYAPGKKITVAGKACGKSRDVNTNMVHLPSCQMIRYKPTPLPPPMDIQNCNAPQLRSPNACQSAPCQPKCN
jgi:hypothetical protein